MVPKVEGEAGETLIEVLISVMLTGIMVVAVLGGLLSAIEASAVQRRSATNEVVTRNFAEALSDAPYVSCATTADYATPPSFEPLDGFTVAVTSVGSWVKGSDPVTFGPFAANCSAASSDTGLQEISYTVEATNGGQSRSHRVLKRYTSTSDASGENPDADLPFGGTRCTITADRDTFVDQQAPTATNGAAETMNLVGTSGSQQEALLYFNLKAGEGTCREDGGTKIPVGKKVLQASLKLYTWQIAGTAPNCATDCKHELRRNTGPLFTETAANWNNRPAVANAATAVFAHGTGDGDILPRHQTATSDQLRSDVSLFYALNSFNRGWTIKRDCAGPSCAAPGTSFEMRTKEWADVNQRPTLTVVFAADDIPGKHLRNIGYDTCASLKNNDFAKAGYVVAGACAGGNNQLWLRPAEGTLDQIKVLNNNLCLETAGNSGAGSVGRTWNCQGANHQKWQLDTTTGQIKYGPASSMCLEAPAPVDGSSLGRQIMIQSCVADRPAQQWLFETPPDMAARPPLRLRTIDTNGPTTNCADLDIGEGGLPGSGQFSWAQTFPCLGETALGQVWTLSADGRLNSQLNPGHCLSYRAVGSLDIASVVPCGQSDAELWIVQGSQIRNVAKSNTCLTNNGGRRWITLTTCAADPVTARQAWLFDDALEDSLANVVQLRNQKFDNCMDPEAVAEGALMRTRPCGESGRDGQEFIVLQTSTPNTFELALRANPALCLTDRNGAATALRTDRCEKISDTNVVPANDKQQWSDNALGLLQRKGTSNCAQGYESYREVRLQTCFTSTVAPADQKSQQWLPEVKGAVTDPTVQQMRNKDTNSCVDMPSGANATSWPCNGPGRAQQGLYLSKIDGDYQIRLAANPTHCLDVQSNATEGAKVVGKTCDERDYVRWTLSAEGRLQTKAVDGGIRRCLEGGNDKDDLTMRICSTSARQRWVFEKPDTSGLVQIRSAANGVCMDIGGGTWITGQPCNSTLRPGQVFYKLNIGQFIPASGGGSCLDAWLEAGKQLQMAGCKATGQSTSWNQTAEGWFRNTYAPGMCAEFNPNNTWVAVQNCTAVTTKPNQLWLVEPTGTPVASISEPLQFRLIDQAGLDPVTSCLDVDGPTRDVFANESAISVLPCLGTVRTNQAFRLSSDGQLHSSTDYNRCLDATSGTVIGARAAMRTCEVPPNPNPNQYWRTDDGRLMNVTKAGGVQRLCLQGGLDGAPATMQTCSTSPLQKWVKEDVGATVRVGAVGRLASAQGDLCLETNRVQAGEALLTWAWTCAQSGRAQQRFVRLNSGQFRPVDNLSFCLDGNGTTEAAVPRTNQCVVPTLATTSAQQWTVDPATGWFKAGNSSLCATAPGFGYSIQQRSCVGGEPSQQWTFRTESSL